MEIHGGGNSRGKREIREMAQRQYEHEDKTQHEAGGTWAGIASDILQSQV